MENQIEITLNDEFIEQITKAIKEAVKEELPKYRDSFRKEWLSTEEVMEMLHVSRRTVQNYRDEGKITYSKLGRKVLYPREGIETFLQEHMNKAHR